MAQTFTGCMRVLDEYYKTALKGPIQVTPEKVMAIFLTLKVSRVLIRGRISKIFYFAVHSISAFLKTPIKIHFFTIFFAPKNKI